VCGIAGIYASNPDTAYRADIERILDAQHRRGPDFRSVESVRTRHGELLLGHNRLAVIDLSPSANQPLWDREHRCCIVLNGEIFNYLELRAGLAAAGTRFITASDTEVVLEAFKTWGVESWCRFNGMFAFALYDTAEEKLYLVRDRFGVKPLYYILRDSVLYFASTAREIASIMNLDISMKYVAGGLKYCLYEHASTAPYAKLEALDPGHWLQIDMSGNGVLPARKHRFYSLFERVEQKREEIRSRTEETLSEEVMALLIDAVRIRLRSDVPVAVSLSGGLDSSTVAFLSSRHSTNTLEGFTFGHPEDHTSEGPVTDIFRRHTGIQVNYVWPGTDDICSAYRDCLHAQAGPFPNGSIVAQYLVFKAAHESGFKVLLGGQGGDESFMGYRKFQWFHARSLMDKKQYLQAILFMLSLIPTVLAEKNRWLDSWKNRHIYLKKEGRESLLAVPVMEMTMGYDTSKELFERQILDIEYAGLPTLLRYEDSNSMGNSVESRLPFMDYRLVEYGIALPESLKLRKGYGKWIIRNNVRGMIPESIRTARFKKGFDIQQERWIEDGLGAYIRSMLHGQLRQVRPWIRRDCDIDRDFSDRHLKKNPVRFAESTALLWLASHAD
jgi:asparagine synthase (glutamine-hydrolysing)